jgi:hypothetical protein
MLHTSVVVLSLRRLAQSPSMCAIVMAGAEAGAYVQSSTLVELELGASALQTLSPDYLVTFVLPKQQSTIYSLSPSSHNM